MGEVDVQLCRVGILTVCEANFPFIHKSRASCSSALYFGQFDMVHELCQKFILKENFTPVWLQVRGKCPYWLYSLPAPVIVNKKCTKNGTVHSSILKLSHVGTLTEDVSCQFYSESFILLPISDGYTEVTLTDTQMFIPHLPELISLQEHHQILLDEVHTHQTLAALEVVGRRKSHVGQQSYVKLHELLTAISTERKAVNQIMWIYISIVFSNLFLLSILTFQCWTRIIRKTTRRLGRYFLSTSKPQSKSTPQGTVVDSLEASCSCRTPRSDYSDGMEVTYAVDPRKEEPKLADGKTPQPQKEVHFTTPGRVQHSEGL
jgi:hypothetical protein